MAYAVWCNDEGHLIDDGTVFCLGADEYRLCTAERQLDWLLDSAIGFDVEIREVTEEVAALAVQGPTSCTLLKAVGLAGVERLKPFEHAALSMRGQRRRRTHRLMVSRTGFTGDLGYELWMQPDGRRSGLGRAHGGGPQPRGPADRLAGAQHGAHRGGLPAAERRFRVRGAHPRTGTERSPLELGLAWLVDFDKGHFTGRRALLAEQARGPRRQLVGLDVEGNKPAHNALLYRERAGRARGRQRDLGDLVADLQAQHRARYGAMRRTSPRARPSGPRSI